MADKCIGKLTLDTKGIDAAVKHVNDELKKLGAGVKVDLSQQVAAEVKKQLDSVLKEIKTYETKMSEAVDKTISKAQKAADKKLENASMKEAVALWKQYYEAMTKAQQAENAGKKKTANYWREEAEGIKEKAQALKDELEVEKELEKVKRTYEASKTAGQDKEDAAAMRDKAKAAKEQEKALKDLAKAQDEQARAVARQKQEADAEQVNKAKQAYIELTDAIKRYNAEKDANNTLGMATEQAKIDQIMEEVGIMQQVVAQSDIEASKKQQILNYINQCTTAEMQHNNVVNGTVKTTGELESQVMGLVTRYLSLMAVIRAINNLIKNMTEYVTEYSDKMNEIQMITLKTDDEVASLASTYRQLAADMKVSSLDMADAAIYFTRQGLEAAEIEDRLKNVTMYAKAANVEFKDASEIITAVVNSMNLIEEEAKDGRTAAQRVADVFLNIGDNAATSGQEIGEAMQKAAASAGTFGVSLEWLSASIAAVSETTRQEARTIGTAFNTIIARLHQIKQKGYNTEDETQINDVAKALAKIDVALMDQAGEWRDYETIMDEVAEKWDTLDGKTKSYIATTMAGVKQQNVFFAWMENRERVMELYGDAVDSAGVAEQKYGVYLDSVAASQEKLNVAQEKFYSLLSQDVIKTWNNILADFVNMVADGAKQFGNWNIILPVVLGLITTVGVAIHGLNMKLGETVTLMTMLERHPIMMAISAGILVIGGLVTVLSAVASAIESDEEKLSRLNKTISESQTAVSDLHQKQNSLTSMMNDVGTETKMTSEELEKYNGLLNDLYMLSPKAAEAVDTLRSGVGDQAEAYKQLNEEIETYLKNEQIRQAYALQEKSSTPHEKTQGEKIAELLLRNEETGKPMSTFEMRDVSDEFLTTIGKMSLDYNGDQIREYIKQTYLDGMEAAEYLAKDIVDQYMDVIGMTMKKVDKDAVRGQLEQLLFGDDGVFNLEEYANSSNVIYRFLSDAISAQFDPKLILGDKYGEVVIRSIAENILGEDFVNNYADQIAEVAKDPSLVSSISEAYEELVAAGFSDLDLEQIYDQVSIKNWGNIIEYISEDIKEQLRDKFGVTDFDINMSEEDFIWDSLDVQTLKTINDLADYGVTLEQINKAMIESAGDVEVFKGKLEELGVATKTPQEELETLASLAKKATASIKDLQAIDTAIKNLQEKNEIDYNSMLSLAEAHPELLTVIGDEQMLLEKLQAVREEASKNQRGILRDMILGTDITKTNYAQYATDQIQTLQDYMESLTDTKDIEDFNAAIEAMVDIWQKANDYTKQDAKETAEETKEVTKSFSEAVKEVEKFDKVIKKLEQNKAIDFSDIIDLSTAHPELIACAGDIEELTKELTKLKEQAKEAVRIKIEEQVLDNTGWFEKNGFAGHGFSNAREVLSKKAVTLEEKELQEQVAQAVKESTENIVGLADAYAELEQTEKDETNASKEATKAEKARQKAYKESLQEIENLDKIIANLQDTKKIDFSNIINLAETHPEIMNFIGDIDNGLIPALERLKEIAMGEALVNLESAMLKDSNFFRTSEFFNPKYNNLEQYLNALEESGGDWRSIYEAMRGIAREMLEGANEASTAAETWLEAQMKIAEVQDEVNWAKANNFEDQIKQLQAANERGGIQEAMTLFNSWDDKMQQAVGTTYPKLVSQFAKASKAIENQAGKVADLTKETEELGSALKTVNKLNDVKYFKDAAKATKDLSEGTISVTDAYEEFNKEINKVSKAYKEIQQVRQKEAYNAKEVNKDNPKDITTNDVQTLADLLNTTAEEVLADFPGAVEMFDELTGSAGELMDVLAMLNREAFIKITGVSEADFSNLENGLFAIRADAEDVIKALEATGQWEVSDPIYLPQSAQVWDPFNNKWISSDAVAKATVLKPTGNNPFKRQSNINGYKDTTTKDGRTGGGGGSNKDKNDSFRDTNTTTEVEKMLDLMSQVNAIQQYQQNYYQSQNKYYSTTGQLQGVIAYMQKEKEVLEGQNGTLESNIRRIEEYMSAKQAELATLSTEDEKYKEVADDFDKLQKAHQTYTKQLIDNKSAVESLNQAMEEQRKKIRQMEIDLRNLILGAIEDREKKRTDMLNAEIEMENTIFDLIVKRYEKERDEIIRTTELKIDALKSERDLLEENLRIRKEQAEAEDKAAKLRELEVKYQRILADPTRAKEAKQLKTEIDDLRKEMAWDLAEEEVKSQQDSIDQQIESLEDYKEYIENYYADLFEHPQQLIAEMREIMMGTQEEIINWLKQNDDAYRESSENTQLAMVTGWEETYNNMKGILKTYWDEVEEIIAQGDDYIIEFLKNNSADYAAAGKLQAEAYVDEWKKQLEDLHKAHQTVSAEIAGSYATIQQYNGNGSSNGGSTGGGTNGGGTSKTTTSTANMTVSAGGSHYYEFTAFGKNYSADKNSSGQYFANRGEAYSAAEQKIDALYQSQKATLDKNGANAYGYNQLAQAYKTAKNSIRAYKTGGIADYTGPAWVDGSPQDPERILTPYQNKLFESFVKTLEKMATISIPSMPNFGALETTGANPVSVGDIIVNVDNLDTDDDYEEMADRVCEILTERIGRTAVVGGLRIRST